MKLVEFFSLIQSIISKFTNLVSYIKWKAKLGLLCLYKLPTIARIIKYVWVNNSSFGEETIVARVVICSQIHKERDDKVTVFF